MDAAGKPEASSLARPMDCRIGATRNFGRRQGRDLRDRGNPDDAGGSQTGKGRRRGDPALVAKAEGLMYVSMSYKGIRKTPGAQASGVFDCSLTKQSLAALPIDLPRQGDIASHPFRRSRGNDGHLIILDKKSLTAGISSRHNPAPRRLQHQRNLSCASQRLWGTMSQCHST